MYGFIFSAISFFSRKKILCVYVLKKAQKSSVNTWKTDSFEFVELNFCKMTYGMLVFR